MSTEELSNLAMELEGEQSDPQYTTVTVEELNKRIEEIASLDEVYKAAKKLSNEADAKVKAKKVEFLNILEALGQNSFDAPAGRLTKVTEKRYKLPDTVEGREQVFGYIQAQYGPEVFYMMTSINHDRFNSFVKEEMEKGSQVPGITNITVETYPQFRKAKV